MSKKKMDKRCPRQLEFLPENYCPLAVQRLKALRHANKELSEEEESKLFGCKWAVSHQMSNYCFFKLIAERMPNSRTLSAAEIAHITSTSVDTVSKVEKKALTKVRQSKTFKDLDEVCGDSVTDDLDGMVDY